MRGLLTRNTVVLNVTTVMWKISVTHDKRSKMSRGSATEHDVEHGSTVVLNGHFQKAYIFFKKIFENCFLFTKFKDFLPCLSILKGNQGENPH